MIWNLLKKKRNHFLKWMKKNSMITFVWNQWQQIQRNQRSIKSQTFKIKNFNEQERSPTLWMEFQLWKTWITILEGINYLFRLFGGNLFGWILTLSSFSRSFSFQISAIVFHQRAFSQSLFSFWRSGQK